MKKNYLFILAFCLLISANSFAQTAADEPAGFKYINPDSTSFSIKTSTPDHFLYKKYSKAGTLIHECTYFSPNIKIKAKDFEKYIKDHYLMIDGLNKDYYADGKLKKEEKYNSGKLIDGCAEYYPSGNVALKKWFSKPGRMDSVIAYNEQGGKRFGIKYNLRYNDTYSEKWFYPNGILKTERYIVKGKLNGNLNTYYANGSPRRIEQYANGQLISSEIKGTDGQPQRYYQYSTLPQMADSLKTIEKLLEFAGSLTEKNKLPSFADIIFKLNKLGDVHKIDVNVNTSNPVIDSLYCKSLKQWCATNIKWTPAIVEKDSLTSQVKLHIEAPYRLDKLKYDFSDSSSLEPIKPDMDYKHLNFAISYYGKGLEKPISPNIMPGYIGGIDALSRFLSDHLKYPPQASAQGIGGRVYVKFVVNKTGELEDITILKGVSPECDAEAMRVVSLMPRWMPGSQYGKPVKVYFTLPILFKLSR